MSLWCLKFSRKTNENNSTWGTIVKSSFSEKATKIWKNLPLILTLLSKNVTTGGRFFFILCDLLIMSELFIGRFSCSFFGWIEDMYTKKSFWSQLTLCSRSQFSSNFYNYLHGNRQVIRHVFTADLAVSFLGN